MDRNDPTRRGPQEDGRRDSSPHDVGAPRPSGEATPAQEPSSRAGKGKWSPRDAQRHRYVPILDDPLLPNSCRGRERIYRRGRHEGTGPHRFVLNWFESGRKRKRTVLGDKFTAIAEADRINNRLSLLGRSGHPRHKPGRLFADRVYDSYCHRMLLRIRGIEPVIAQRNTGHGSRPGRFRCVVERTLSWLHQFRRLRVGYERRADIHEALLSLGSAMICWHTFRVGFC